MTRNLNRFCWYSTGLLCATAILNPGQAQEPSRTSKPLILVKAKVESVGTNDQRSQPATLVITHVYSGNSELLGKSFVDLYRDQDINGASAVEPFKVKQEGIWSLRLDKEKLSPDYISPMPFNRRSRPEESDRYKQIMALAEAIEDYGKQKASDRIGRAKELSKSDIPEVSVWAIQTLNLNPSSEVTDFFEGQAKKPEITRAAQATLDQVLVERKKSDWMNSETRKKFLESLVKSETDEYQAQQILTRVDLAVQRKDISLPLAIDLARMAAENNKWPLSMRSFAISRVGAFSNRTMNHDACFKWLFQHVEANPTLELRRAAAYTIKNTLKLTETEKNIVKARLPMETDKEVVSALREAVEK